MPEPSLAAEVAELVRAAAKVRPEVLITADSHLIDDLGIDSLDLVGVLVKVQDHYDVVIDDDDVPSLLRVSDLAAYVARGRGMTAAA